MLRTSKEVLACPIQSISQHTSYDDLATFLAPHAGHNAQRALIFLLAATISTSLAWLSLRFFETPFLKLRTRYKSSPALV
jgi:peptidoglycan/LPS O-acetylase OafA/YrhL